MKKGHFFSAWQCADWFMHIKLTIIFLLAFFSLSINAQADMKALDDNTLSDVTGQSFLISAKTVDTGQNITFYKEGLDATLDINANIGSLQLGCGGINGAGKCDIDIDNFSLSGIPSSSSCSSANRADCDAVLTHPFVQFAIKNDNNLATRQLVGFQLSAEQISALITAGTNGATPNGINSLSGYLTTTPITGTATTKTTNIGGKTDPTQTVLKFPLYANVLACTSGCGSLATYATSVPSTSTGIDIASMPVIFNGDSSVNGGGALINGTRQTYTSVSASADIPTVDLVNGSLNVNLSKTISVLLVINLSSGTVLMQSPSSVTGLKAKINFDEALGYIHSLTVDNTPFYISFENGSVKWPGSVGSAGCTAKTYGCDIAQQGWWMSFGAPANLGPLSPTQQVDISPSFGTCGSGTGATNPCTPNSMAAAFYQYYYNQGGFPVNTTNGLQQIFNGQMTVPLGNLSIAANLALALQNMALGKTQDVLPNCYGSSKFC